jgi:hypothetical protein
MPIIIQILICIARIFTGNYYFRKVIWQKYLEMFTQGCAMQTLLSVILPCSNEERSIEQTHQRFLPHLAALNRTK